MPDPALLALVQHFASAPPAIVQPALMTDAKPFLSAYEAIADEQDRELKVWLDKMAALEQKTRIAIGANPQSFSAHMFDEIADSFEHYLRWQKKDTARLERRSVTHMSKRAQRLKDRTLARQRQRSEAASALVAFVREIRGELIARKRIEAALKTRTPNATTITAMREAEAGGLPRFATVADLMADLHADD